MTLSKPIIQLFESTNSTLDEEASCIISSLDNPTEVVLGTASCPEYDMVLLKQELVAECEDLCEKALSAHGKVGVRDLCFYNRIAITTICTNLQTHKNDVEVLQWFKQFLNALEGKA